MDSESKGKCGLLSLLPKPKNTNLFNFKKENAKTLPQSLLLDKNASDIPNKKAKLDQNDTLLTNNIKSKKPEVTAIVSSLVSYEGSSNESSDNEYNDDKLSDSSINSKHDEDILNDKSDDFFEENSSFIDTSNLTSTVEEEISFNNEVMIGPNKPQSVVNYSYPTLTDNNDSLNNHKNLKTYNEQQVTKLIYEKELALYGGTTDEAAELASKIIDVNVDKELGPNVKQNLLKNLNNKALAQVALGPLPKIKKDPSDRLSKQKHQITHLAGLAVAREEMLQEKWANNNQKKKASSRRYGF